MNFSVWYFQLKEHDTYYLPYRRFLKKKIFFSYFSNSIKRVKLIMGVMRTAEKFGLKYNWSGYYELPWRQSAAWWSAVNPPYSPYHSIPLIPSIHMLSHWLRPVTESDRTLFSIIPMRPNVTQGIWMKNCYVKPVRIPVAFNCNIIHWKVIICW